MAFACVFWGHWWSSSSKLGSFWWLMLNLDVTCFLFLWLNTDLFHWGLAHDLLSICLGVGINWHWFSLNCSINLQNMGTLSIDDFFNVSYFDALILCLSLKALWIDDLLVLSIHIVWVSWNMDNIVLLDFLTLILVQFTYFFYDFLLNFLFIFLLFNL